MKKKQIRDHYRVNRKLHRSLQKRQQIRTVGHCGQQVDRDLYTSYGVHQLSGLEKVCSEGSVTEQKVELYVKVLGSSRYRGDLEKEGCNDQ